MCVPKTVSVKQVSAERLENFCLENLERISVDKNYVDNLVFRLNNDNQTPQYEKIYWVLYLIKKAKFGRLQRRDVA